MIPFNNRFHGHSSLNFVYKNGKAVRSRSMTIKTITNPHRKTTRVAVIVGKKVAKSAVSRNRIRRRVFEYIRLKLPLINGIYDIVVIVLASDLLTVPYGDLSQQIDQLFEQSGLKQNSQAVPKT